MAERLLHFHLNRNKCISEWNAYAEAVRNSGLSLDGGNGSFRYPSISEVMASRLQLDPKVFSAALRIRGEHLKASAELSKHLSKHRC